MTVTQQQVADTLRGRDRKLMETVLDAAEVWYPAHASSEELAQRFAKALWWRTHSPLSQAVIPDALGDMIDHVEKKLDLSFQGEDDWERLESLTKELSPMGRAVTVEELDEPSRSRLEKAIWLDLTGLSVAGGATASRAVARWILKSTRGPLWDIVRRIPKLGPVLGAVRAGAGSVVTVAGPAAVAVALLTLNHTLGARYDRAIPLLVGLGLICRNPVVYPYPVQSD